MRHNIGIVIIGRNEGDRLRACFESIREYSSLSVYVDSGSTDNSIEIANKYGISVVHLDTSIPFSAARARNEGANYLLGYRPNIEFIQFIDGDCVINEYWVEYAVKKFKSDVAIVCGRRLEKYPEQSLYNQLCDIEWNTPIGESKSCGGDFIIKSELFTKHEGFNPSVIAGEEPELCYRLRKSGYKILRVDHDMTYHDANIHTFRQHWIRNVRGGYAYALGYYMHNEVRERHFSKQLYSALFWGLALPTIILLLTFLDLIFLYLLFIYPINVFRIYLKFRGSVPIPFIMSLSLVIGKFAETYGILKFLKTLIFSDKHKIIEYK